MQVHSGAAPAVVHRSNKGLNLWYFAGGRLPRAPVEAPDKAKHCVPVYVGAKSWDNVVMALVLLSLLLTA